MIRTTTHRTAARDDASDPYRGHRLRARRRNLSCAARRCDARVQLAAIVTRDEARRASARAAYPDVRLVADVEEILSPNTNIGLVVITTPNSTHGRIARATIDAGIACVVDKPFAATADEARDIGRLAKDKGVVVVPFHNRRWDADFLTLRTLIDDGALGSVFRFESRFERLRATPKPR